MTPSGSAKGRVIIIGGSMAGLFAAVTLRSLGWQADIYERDDEFGDEDDFARDDYNNVQDQHTGWMR